MKVNVLKSKLTLNEINVKEFHSRLNELITISYDSLLKKMKSGEFRVKEIRAIKKVLNLSDTEFLDIFFTQ